MTNISKAICILALFILASVGSPDCHGQSKLHSFFDSDETSTHRALVTNALQQICPEGQLSRDPQGNARGCSECPLQTTEHDAKGLDWTLSRAFTGHFTSVDEENIVLSGVGCEPHSANFGGTFIFAVNGPALKLLEYSSGLITETCHKFRVPNSPDMLVCTHNWGAQVTLWSYVYLVKFRQDGRSDVQHIFEVLDMSQQPCGIDFYDDSETTVQKAEITSLSLANSGEKRPALVITARLGEKTPNNEERRACQQEQKAIPLTLKSYQLEFTFEDGVFRPSPESKKSLKLFPNPESDENPWLP
jgi:hypothetical protein